MPQFTDEKPSTLGWLTIVYQSNKLLNEQNHEPIRTAIVERLMESKEIAIKEIHSYVHCQLIVGVEMSKTISSYKTIKKILQTKFVGHNPPLLFSVNMVAHSNTTAPYIAWMHIEGQDEGAFVKSIEHVFPKKINPKPLVKPSDIRPSDKLIPRKN